MSSVLNREKITEDLDEDLGDQLDEIKAKRAKIDETNEEFHDKKLEAFLNWCRNKKIFIDTDKVKVVCRGTSHNYGMIAIKDINKDEILARVPKSEILEPSTSQINEVLKKNSKSLKSKSNWSKLIITLMFEMNNPDSKWREYLDCFPNYDLFDLPMFWEPSELKSWLENTCIPKNVAFDLENMKNEFESIIKPFLEQNRHLFDEKCFDFEYYKRIVGFIMAYSFRDPNEDPDDSEAIGPMMVPIGDVLNHIAKNNAQIRFEMNELLIVSIKIIKKDEEVFNTYGEHSNSDLLHMYGFVETFPHNTFDAVEIPTKCFIEAFRKEKIDPLEVANKKIETLLEMELIDRTASIIIGHDGILNEEECLHIFQIYSMPVDDFSEFLENDCELLSDEEWDNFSLVNENICKIPIAWKDLIRDSCNLHTDHLKMTFEKLNATKVEPIDDEIKRNKIVQRLNSSKILIESQLKLIHNFITCLDK